MVGASLAGLRAVEALRREGYEGRITLVGAEPHEPYDRPPLSKDYLAGSTDRASLALRKQGFDDLDVELTLGSAAHIRSTSRRARSGSVTTSSRSTAS